MVIQALVDRYEPLMRRKCRRITPVTSVPRCGTPGHEKIEENSRNSSAGRKVTDEEPAAAA